MPCHVAMVQVSLRIEALGLVHNSFYLNALGPYILWVYVHSYRAVYILWVYVHRFVYMGPYTFVCRHQHSWQKLCIIADQSILEVAGQGCWPNPNPHPNPNPSPNRLLA